MYLLGPFYRWIVEIFADRVNHLPLVRLFIFSLDHAIVLFIGWLIVWSISLLFRKRKRIVWKWELYRNLFIFYLILLSQVTIFRNLTNPLPWKLSCIHSQILCGFHSWIVSNSLCKGRYLQRIIM